MSDYYAPRFEIRITGITLGEDVTNQVVRVSYENNADLADMFTLELRNSGNQFTDSPLFDLDKAVEIHMGYGADLQPMMLGLITSVQPVFPADGPMMMRVSGYDKSYKLRHNQPARVPYRYMPDSAIAALIAVEAGLIPVVDPSIYFHEQIQQTGSDMAFLKERARANFFETYVWWDQLYFRFPRPQLQAYVLQWGKNLSSFSPRLSAAGMAGLQVIRGYNEELAQAIIGIASGVALDLNNVVEKLGTAVFDLLTSLGRNVLRDQNVSSPLDATALAISLLRDLLEGMYEGEGECVGIPDLRANSSVEVRGVGKRFSGQYRLKKVTHTIDDHGYRTRFEVSQRDGTGLLPLLRKKIVEMPPPNEAKTVDGVAVAKVTNNVDPEARGRVKLSFPWFSDDYESDWTRCATPMAGSGVGAYFLPDVGDEVLVAFTQGDFNSPVVLGGLWNGVARPPLTLPNPRNLVRLIKTKAGSTITIDDTPGAGKIEVKNAGGTSVTLNANGTVTIHGLNVELTADQNITLKAVNVNVSVSGTMDVS
ncbi:MAG TPA: phage baseplate assembly protein V [Gemmataceae bacterium]|nr:phage baseplate assembly protein V [Gemmataceae bacterium]